MRDVPFNSPVNIETDQPGRYLAITHVKQAADFLMNRWPGDKGPKHRAALEAVLGVLEEGKDASLARAALVEAAGEADVFVRDR